MRYTVALICGIVFGSQPLLVDATGSREGEVRCACNIYVSLKAPIVQGGSQAID